MASSFRLPAEVDQRLDEHCSATGATKNRVVIIALTNYLDAHDPAQAKPRAARTGSALDSVPSFQRRPRGPDPKGGKQK